MRIQFLASILILPTTASYPRRISPFLSRSRVISNFNFRPIPCGSAKDVILFALNDGGRLARTFETWTFQKLLIFQQGWNFTIYTTFISKSFVIVFYIAFTSPDGSTWAQAVKENSDGKYDKIFCTVPLACSRRKRDNIEEACERVKWETRVKRIRDRNGCRFVMSGVEMTVPFVLKFVVFSVCQGVESLRDETTLYRPLSRSRSKEMSFPRRELSRKAGYACLRLAWFDNIIIFIANKGNIAVDHRSLLL